MLLYTGTFSAAEVFLNPSPDLCLDTVLVYTYVLRLDGWVCALTCAVTYGSLCSQLCAFPNHVQLNLPQTGCSSIPPPPFMGSLHVLLALFDNLDCDDVSHCTGLHLILEWLHFIRAARVHADRAGPARTPSAGGLWHEEERSAGQEGTTRLCLSFHCVHKLFPV